MGISIEAQRVIDEKKKTTDQIVLDPNIFLVDFPLDPWTPYIKTNNFLQQGISRVLGYDPTLKKWARLQVDSDGKLQVSGITTLELSKTYFSDGTTWRAALCGTNGSPYFTIYDRETFDDLVIDDVEVDAGATITHEAIDLGGVSSFNVQVSASQNCAVYPQSSDDNINFYDLKSAADGDLTYNCNNEKIAFPVSHPCHYFRIAIKNNGAATATVRAVVTSLI